MAWYTPMTHLSETASPIRRQLEDALRRARQLPVGPNRNDLRQLAKGLRWLEKHGRDERVRRLVRSQTRNRRPDHCNQAEVFTADQETLRHQGPDLEERGNGDRKGPCHAARSGLEQDRARALTLRNAADLLNIVFPRLKRAAKALNGAKSPGLGPKASMHVSFSR